ncbi:HU family DNA-binding protein [Sulfobacillus thermosulfidooxidans]|uniref:HU family DNA-binding protein n=1 Tax=Sulfobacillus thermosulfidooxidans TaxID=28034 RepID=UPI000308CF5E|nr:HU family DNA-binding protein [Sulfobacillus thermosulfidooxidans]
MYKSDLIRQISDDTLFTLKDTQEIVEAFLNTVTTALAAGEPIHLIGFGTFTTKTLSGRTVRLPDGRSLVLSARTRPVFRPSKSLCAMVDHRG